MSPDPGDRVGAVIEWAASMGLVTSARVLRRATRDFVALPEAKLLVRIAPARAANLARAARETAAGCLLADASVPAERPAPGHRQPLRIGGAVATVWELVPRTTEQVTPAQLGALARRLHDATADLARRPGTARLDPFGAIHTALGDARRGGALGIDRRRGGACRAPIPVCGDGGAGGSAGLGDRARRPARRQHGGERRRPGAVGSGALVAARVPTTSLPVRSRPALRRHRRGFEALLSDDGDDPRRWRGFETFCQVYELWVTAWALGQTQLRLGRRRRRACRNARRPRWQLW